MQQHSHLHLVFCKPQTDRICFKSTLGNILISSMYLIKSAFKISFSQPFYPTYPERWWIQRTYPSKRVSIFRIPPCQIVKLSRKILLGIKLRIHIPQSLLYVVGYTEYNALCLSMLQEAIRENDEISCNRWLKSFSEFKPLCQWFGDAHNPPSKLRVLGTGTHFVKKRALVSLSTLDKIIMKKSIRPDGLILNLLPYSCYIVVQETKTL